MVGRIRLWNRGRKGGRNGRGRQIEIDRFDEKKRVGSWDIIAAMSRGTRDEGRNMKIRKG